MRFYACSSRSVYEKPPATGSHYDSRPYLLLSAVCCLLSNPAILPPMFLARVYVTLKPTVNDPPGLTIRGGLHSLGFTAVESVRSGKYMEIRLDAKSQSEAESQVTEMCRKLLANPVIEDFRFELEQLATT